MKRIAPAKEQRPDFLDLRDAFWILRRQVRLVLLTVGIGLGGALLYLAYATPLYTATALLFVDPSQKNILNPDDAYTLQGSAENARIESEVEILRSDTVMLAAIDAAGLLADPEFGPSLPLLDKLRMAVGLEGGDTRSGAELLSSTLARLTGRVDVRRRGTTYLIAVSVHAQSPDRAATIANAVAQTYIDLQIGTKVSAALAMRDMLQGQLDAARLALTENESALASYVDDNIDRLVVESGSEAARDLRDRLLEANTRSGQTRDLLTNARTLMQDQDWSGLAARLEDEALAQMDAERAALAAQLAGAAPATGAEADLRAGLARIESDMARRAQGAVASLESQATQIDTMADQVRVQIREQVFAANLSAGTLAELFEMQQESDIAQRHYRTLLSRMRDLEAQALVQVADSRIVSQAMAPRSASFPNKKLILSLALFSALGLGVGLAFLNEYYLGGILSAQQLGNLVDIPVGATIPRVEVPPDRLSVADMVVDAPLSAYAESLRRLRSAVDQAVRGREGGAVVVFTSSIPDEGKSTLALALARTYAIAGRKVLLVDADLRRPALHRLVGLEPQDGFLDYLNNPGQFDDAQGFYDVDPRTGAGLIMGQRRSPAPTDQLLQTKAFEDILINARAAVDIGIVDAPAILPTVDARYIVAQADVVVFCVGYGTVSQSEVRAALAQIEDAAPPGTAILAVLNRDESPDRSRRFGEDAAGLPG